MYYAVIMAGGTGTRLWPLSRHNQPKQALKLAGERTMFQYAVERIVPLFPIERITVVTRFEHADILREQVPQLPAENFILEPEGRGTAPAIGLAAIHLRHRDPKAVMAVLTADHFITKTDRFCRVLEAAYQIASDGSLVTLGIQPSSSSTGYGYIQNGSALDEKNGFRFYAVQRFIEKPDAETAAQMLKSGEYTWNSGMFIWQVERILEEIERQMPEFYAQLMAVDQALGSAQYEEIVAHIWPRVAQQTVDYGVMEAARQVVVVPADIGWTDIGSWGSLFDLLPADPQGNILVGPNVLIDTQNTLAFGSQRLIAAIGLQDMLIVDADDAILVCPKDREQEVRSIVERINNEGLRKWQ